MPPKKADKKDDPAKFVDKENLQRAETEILSLQHLVEQRTQEAVEARVHERQWRERVHAFSDAYEKQKSDTQDITSDMQRQYRVLQDQMTSRVSTLEAEKAQLLEVIRQKDEEIARLNAREEEIEKDKTDEVAEYRRRMEDMQIEFAQLMRETLDKLHHKLEKSFTAEAVAD